MPTRWLRLNEYPSETVLELACDKCGRCGHLSKGHRVAEYGADASPPDLWTRLAMCDRATSMQNPCEVYSVDASSHASPEAGFRLCGEVGLGLVENRGSSPAGCGRRGRRDVADSVRLSALQPPLDGIDGR